MLNFWNALVKYLEKRPYWEAIQPFFLLAFGAVVTEVAAYQYVRAQCSQTQISLFLGSYLSVRILASAAGLLVLLVLLKMDPGRRNRPEPGRLVALYRGT